MARIIHVDGTIVPLPPKQDSEDGTHKVLSLDQLQKAVGGYIEIVRLPDGRPWGICHEEGKLEGKAFNTVATSLWYTQCGFVHGDYLVGDIIVLDAENEIE